MQSHSDFQHILITNDNPIRETIILIKLKPVHSSHFNNLFVNLLFIQIYTKKKAPVVPKITFTGIWETEKEIRI